MARKKKILDAKEKRFRQRLVHQQRMLVQDMIRRGLIYDTDTALFERSLALILAEAFDEIHPALKALEFLPAAPTIDMGAASIISQGHTRMGKAAFTTSYDIEVQRVQVQGRESAILVGGVLDSYFISYQQIQEAAFSGVPLDSLLASAAYDIVAEGIDRILSLGSASHNITGMLNAPGVTRWQLGTTGTTVGSWANVGTTDLQIIQDLAMMVDEVKNGTLYIPTHLALGPLEYARLIRPQPATGYGISLKEVLEKSYSLVIEEWERLRLIPATVAVGGATSSSVLYFKDRKVFNPAVSTGPEQYPPKVDLLGYEVAVHRRTGGVASTHPKGALYADMA